MRKVVTSWFAYRCVSKNLELAFVLHNDKGRIEEKSDKCHEDSRSDQLDYPGRLCF
jgi:hypothetical protein